MVKNIFNIPSSCSLVDVLAKKILDEYQDNPLKLTEVLILLPNRRACLEMRDAFVRLKGMSPTLLPIMSPLGDVDEDEIILKGTMPKIAPAISSTERMLLFVRLITARPIDFEIENISFSQACYLAQELASLVDMVNNHDLDFSGFAKLVPEEYATHWQKTLNFLQIITHHLPNILQERGLIDAAERKKQLLKIQNCLWQKNPPSEKVIIAGNTATFPAMKELIKTISKLENGAVYLAGLDKNLDQESWEQIDESHPQFELKELLDFLELSRFEIADACQSLNQDREILVSEVMRPAKTTDKWRNLSIGNITSKAIEGLNLLNCREIRDEALAIALVMRKTLNTPEKTAALVTTDRNLARRVAGELQRWQIKVDDSAGKPLSQTPVGIFLRLIAKVCNNDFNDIDLLSLLKHPLSSAETSFRNQTRNFEKIILRQQKQDDLLHEFISQQKQKLQSFYLLCSQKQANFSDLIVAHLQAAEALATTSQKSGAEILWQGEDGEAAAKTFSDLLEHADSLGIVPQGQYLELIQAIFTGIPVRPKYGTHPRLKILGPMEARLNNFDTIIIGEVNEGSMPSIAPSGAWLSRPMKKDFGFPLPEKAIGILAFDFAQLLAKNEVFLTRAERVQATPMVKSRWWMRLETVLNAAGIDAKSLDNYLYTNIAQKLDKSDEYQPISAPCPKPPLTARPRELSATAIENLMRDPYIIYAKYILKLKPLEEINPEPQMSDFGNIVHNTLEEFCKKYPLKLSENAEAELLAIGERIFNQNKISNKVRAFWYPNFIKMMQWVLQKEQTYRPTIIRTNCEVKGSFSFNSPQGKFTLTAKADRIDETIDGKINIIDYKTGSARSKTEIKTGYAPQMPIEAIIAQSGGFENIAAKQVNLLAYWKLGKEEISLEENLQEVIETNLNNIKELIAVFDDEDKAYLTQPNPKYAPAYSDYEHLSRIKEWGIIDNNDE